MIALVSIFILGIIIVIRAQYVMNREYAKKYNDLLESYNSTQAVIAVLSSAAKLKDLKKIEIDWKWDAEQIRN